MSASVRVRLFFGEEGLRAFPALFAEHRRAASAFAGFISLRHCRLDAAGGNNEVELTLEFESEALLKQWRSSPEHAQVAAGYRRYWTREPEVVLFAAPS
ncbi:MAG: antibiotic biosynthesis monooxygenase [Verrucomicrobia bacterium]|nr:antibiotic biosynthesis monooxygenase [Verrucomicrobiota bacterium]